MLSKLKFITAGESHGPGMTAIIEGLPAGIRIDIQAINQELARRQQGYGAGPRMKIESDRADILAGMMNGETIGAPVAVFITNKDHAKWHGKPIPAFTNPRPGHADLAATLKYGYPDIRPSLERASARETVARVAIGALCKQFLNAFGVQIFGYVIAIGPIKAEVTKIPLSERGLLAESNPVRCPDQEAAIQMQTHIKNTIKNRDTAGGVIESVALNVPPGLGSHVHWERKLDARLAAAIISIPAIKGVEIGSAFENTAIPGTEAQDSIQLNGKQITRPTNRHGGLEGGITTGQPIILRAAMKPIATTLSPQNTVNLATGKTEQTNYERSDFCPVPRAVPILESMMAIVLADALIEKLGGDSLDEMLHRFQGLPKTELNDFHIDGEKRIWWV